MMGFSGNVRRSEWVLAIFLIYSAALAAALPVPPQARAMVILSHLAILFQYGLLIQLDAANRVPALSVIRDWAPLALILMAYREMGVFARPPHGHALEAAWLAWDRVVLHGGAKSAIEALGPVLPAVLELAYAIVYLLAPFALAMLYIAGRRREVDRFLFVFVTGVLLCYVQFPFWPSEPPRVLFAGQDLPAYDTVFRRFNGWLLGNLGIHTSVFPSAHVAGAFSAAFGAGRAMPARNWAIRLLLVMAVLIAIATVYGRYHYVTDASAGFLMAVFAGALSRDPRVSRKRAANTGNRDVAQPISRA